MSNPDPPVLPDGTMADLASDVEGRAELEERVSAILGDSPTTETRNRFETPGKPLTSKVSAVSLVSDFGGVGGQARAASSNFHEAPSQTRGAATRIEEAAATPQVRRGYTAPSATQQGNHETARIDLDNLLRRTRETIDEYLWFPSEHHVTVLTLFVASTYTSYPTAPYILLHSPEPESGKSTTLDVLGALVHNPLQIGDTSAAALYRHELEGTPTWLLDEIGKLLKGEKDRATQVASILNNGYKGGPGSRVARVERVGEKQVRREFDTFGPKVPASLENLDHLGDFLSRTIVLPMQRKPPSIKRRPAVSAFIHNRFSSLREEWEALSPFLAALLDEQMLELKYERNAERFNSGRLSETWTPLLEIARQAEGAWRGRALAAADHFRAKRADRGLADHQQLLRDTWLVLVEKGADRISSMELVDALVDLGESSPWAARWQTGLNQRRYVDVDGDVYRRAQREVAELFKTYEIRPKQMKFNGVGLKGYARDDLQPAISTFHPDLLAEGTPVPTLPEAETAETPKPSQVNGLSGGSPATRQGNSAVRQGGSPRRGLRLFACAACGHQRNAFDDLTGWECVGCHEGQYEVRAEKVA